MTVWDDPVVRWLAGLRLPGLTGLMEAIAASTGSAGMIGALRWGTLLALLLLRRFRYLVAFVGSFPAVSLSTVDRPRLVAEGSTVTIQLTATCDVPAAAASHAIAPGVTRFQVQGARGPTGAVDVLPGGCVTYRPGPDGGSASVALPDQAQRAVTYQTRDNLREALWRRPTAGSSLTPQAAIRKQRIRRWEREVREQHGPHFGRQVAPCPE